jgi:hypothetical protein
MNQWERMARDSEMRVFPIRIEKTAGKWDKIPLVNKWQSKANFHALTNFDWSEANGFGILMGLGYYTLDLDTYKSDETQAEAWFDHHEIIRETRTHMTVSGGLHRIYAVRVDLPTRSNIVPGLDGRGTGGFIAFGEGYSIVDSRYPVMMSRSAREDIAAGAHGGGKIDGIEAYVDGHAPPEPENAQQKLTKVLTFGPKLLKLRWNGDATGLHDKSRSAMDHSVAALMARAGCDEDMIIWTLLTQFRHGAARHKPNGKVSVRAAARSALKSKQKVTEERNAVEAFKDPEMTDKEEEAVAAALRDPFRGR